MTNFEEEAISNIDGLYTKNENGEFEKVENVLDYIEKQIYANRLKTYMKYRNFPRYCEYGICGGGSGMRLDDNGRYVYDADKGEYINIYQLKSQLNEEDIEKELEKIRNQYAYDVKFSWNESVCSFVPDIEGSFIYNYETKKFQKI